MHIELTEMLRCPESHREEMLVLSTGEVKDRMVRSGLVGCPVCHKEYPISRGVVNFRRSKERVAKESSGPRPAYQPPSPLPSADAARLQALLELSGPGGYVVLVGSAARQAERLVSSWRGSTSSASTRRRTWRSAPRSPCSTRARRCRCAPQWRAASLSARISRRRPGWSRPIACCSAGAGSWWKTKSPSCRSGSSNWRRKTGSGWVRNGEQCCRGAAEIGRAHV